MSSTSKDRLTQVKDSLDSLFSNAHPSDREDLIKDLRSYLSLQNAAGKHSGYDRKASPGDSTQDH